MKQFFSKGLIKIGLMVAGAALFCGFGVGQVVAADADPVAVTDQANFQQELVNTSQWLELILQILYLFMRPLLTIAGYAMDNHMVYGEFINLGAPLWKLRNIMKNFANFGLGFYVVYAIGNYALTKTGKPTDILRKALIAGVGIQASWFLLGAVLDISTVATYSIGGLPLTVLGQSEEMDQPVIGYKSKIDMSALGNKLTGMWASKEWIVFYRSLTVSGQVINVQRCRVGWPSSNSSGAYIAKLLTGFSDADITASADYCFLPSTNINDSDIYRFPAQAGYLYIGGSPNTYDFTQDFKNYTPTSGSNVYKCDGTNGCVRSGVVLKPDPDSGVQSALKMSDLLKTSNGFMGPLYTLYASILNFWALNDTLTTGMLGISLVHFIFKAAFAVALLLPLVIFAVVMMIRVLLLWLVVIFSPIYALKWSFGKDLPDVPILSGIKIGKGKGEDTIGGVLGLIFAPVVVVFAMSIGLLFMRSIEVATTNNQSVESKQMELALGIQGYTNNSDASKPQQCRNIYVTDMCIQVPQTMTEASTDLLNIFNYILLNCFALGICWGLLSVALKSSSVMAGIADTFEGLAKNLLSEIPLPVPMPGGGGDSMRLGTALQLPGSLVTGLNSKYTTQVSDQLGQLTNRGGSTGTTRGGSTGTAPAFNYQTLSNVLTDQTPAGQMLQGMSGAGVRNTDISAFLDDMANTQALEALLAKFGTGNTQSENARKALNKIINTQADQAGVQSVMRKPAAKRFFDVADANQANHRPFTMSNNQTIAYETVKTFKEQQ